MRAILNDRDITALYRALTGRGLSQSQIARITDQKQSEVCEIVKGRTVQNVALLERIADGLGIPRDYIRLPASAGAYHEGAPSSGAAEEVDENMLRRDVLAKGSIALVGVPVLGKLLAASDSAGPGELGLPSQVGTADVAEIKNTTEQLRAGARLMGGQARAVSAAAVQYGRLTSVPPASDAVRTGLFSHLAELNELAGWCCFDSGSDLHARWHYRQAVDLAHQVGDHYRMASATRFMGVIDGVRDNLGHAMKQYEMASLVLGPKGDPELHSWLHALSAKVLARMEHSNAADELAKAQDDWRPANALESADMVYQTALVHMDLGNLDTAEQLAASVNGAGRHRPVGVFASVLRATIHVQAGEPRGLLMARSAIDAVAPLHSVRARERLQPLATALNARPGNDYRELARTANAIATSRTAAT